MITTFGEIMLRISPQLSGERVIQAKNFRIEPGGSESNVAIALSELGASTTFLTCLPDNELAQIVLRNLKQHGVDTSNICIKGDRIGMYWTETGLGPRNSFVVYDRDNSAFCISSFEDYSFTTILQNSEWFHFSGISPALNQGIANLLAKVVNDCPCPYSVDLNYRGKLWNWADKDPAVISKVMTSLCKKATLLAGNETDFGDILGIFSKKENKEDAVKEIAKKCFEMFPNAKYISISDREPVSATIINWSGFLFVKESVDFIYKGNDFTIDHVTDRVGTGDSFVSGIIWGLTHQDRFTYQDTIDFAVALSALNHTTFGDASFYNEADVIKALKTGGSGRIVR